MDFDVNGLEVVNNEAEKRFEVRVGDQIAMIEYMIAGKNIIFTHTEVPPEFEGRGVANRMAKVALDHAREKGYRVNPVCPFMSLYIRKHQEYQDITIGY